MIETTEPLLSRGREENICVLYSDTSRSKGVVKVAQSVWGSGDEEAESGRHAGSCAAEHLQTCRKASHIRPIVAVFLVRAAAVRS